MKLQEVFKQVYQWQWIEQHEDNWQAAFETEGGHAIDVAFVAVEEDSKSEWRVDFMRFNPEYDDYESSITGEGDAFRILGTVADIVNAFIRAQPEAGFIYGSIGVGEEKRLPVYKRLFDRTLPDNWSASIQTGALVLTRWK